MYIGIKSIALKQQSIFEKKLFIHFLKVIIGSKIFVGLIKNDYKLSITIKRYQNKIK